MEMFSTFYLRVLYNYETSRWYYELYKSDGHTKLCDSTETFDSEGEARYGAIGHISLFEKAPNS